MSRSVLEAVFRHKILLGLPVVVCFLLAAAGGSQMGRDYTAAASFWADTPAPDESTNGTTGTNGGGAPPSAGESTWLMQLMQTRAFMRDVVLASPLAEDYNEADPLGADQILGAAAASVAVAATGPQLVTITVHRPDEAEALGLANSVLEQFDKTKVDQAVARAKENVDFNKRALDAAKAAAKSSDDTTTERRLAESQEAFDNSVVSLAAAESTGLTVVDTPDNAHPSSRMQSLIMAAAGGMLAGMTLSIILLLMILSRDTSVRNEKDAATALGLPVVGSVPDAPAKGSRSWNPSNRLRQSEDSDRELVGS